MFKFEELALKRRSIRKFTNEPVPDELIEKLLHIGMSGPSACNRKPWEFYVITNEDVLKQLEHASMFTKHKSPLKFVVCGNLSKSLPGSLSDYWIQDCAAALTHILLGVTDCGLGACWEGVYPQQRVIKRVSKALNLPKNHIPLGIISIGYPAENPNARDQYDKTAVHFIK